MKNQTRLMALTYLRKRPGQVCHYKDIAADLNYQGEAQNISTALSRIVRDYPSYGVRREGAGGYVYRPNLETDPETKEPVVQKDEYWELVGNIEGMRLLKDESGDLWIARKFRPTDLSFG